MSMKRLPLSNILIVRRCVEGCGGDGHGDGVNWKVLGGDCIELWRAGGRGTTHFMVPVVVTGQWNSGMPQVRLWPLMWEHVGVWTECVSFSAGRPPHRRRITQ